MRNKKVSIIVPTKNSARTIANCLESIKKQSYSNTEIIVVDNNSDDETINIAKKYTSLIFNYGPERSSQRNYGFAKSTGHFVMFIDSDMVLTNPVVQECVDSISSANTKMVVIPETSFGVGFWSKCKKMERDFYQGINWMEAARFFTSNVFNEIGGYDEKNTGTEDYDLPQRVSSMYGDKCSARTQSIILHDEGKIVLLNLLKKKFYYAKKLGNYIKKEENSLNYKLQSSIIKRFTLFFSKPSLFFENPIIYLGMIFMKLSEFAAGGLGYYLFRKKYEN